jgi:exosortase A-associated hydrolase 1
VGVLHHGNAGARTGIVVVTGGPQYRIGSHRQFLLLARTFAAAGVPTFRFDHRGSGDSEGPAAGFEDIGADIAAAIATFAEHAPGLEKIVLWGLCDAASAILLSMPMEPRVSGLVLLNPWVRSDDSEARAMVKHYYGGRFLDRAFWRKLISGKVDLFGAISGFVASFGVWTRARMGGRTKTSDDSECPLPQRMAQGLAAFHGPVLLLISGRDLTAREFEDAATDYDWPALLAENRMTRHELPSADHTFSRQVWRKEVADATLCWLTTDES